MIDDKYSDELIDTIRHFIAETCVDAAVIRNQGKGVCGIIREFLKNQVDLREVSSNGATGFASWLDDRTEAMLDTLRESLDLPNRPWGTARKAMNIFLRSALYNHFLRIKYDLEKMEASFEIPLDSHVATELKRRAGDVVIPDWPGLKDLNRAQSERFQEFAQILAKCKNLPARVYLDHELWMPKG